MQEKRVPKDDINSRVKAFALAKYGSVKGLAEALGKNYANVHKYISGTRKPGLTFLDELKSLGCNVDWIRTGEGKMYAEKEEKKTEPAPEHDRLTAIENQLKDLQKALQPAPEPLEQVQIPLYQHAVSAGPACIVSEEIEEYLSVPKKIARHPRETFAVKASGDSMKGEDIREGDIIICDSKAAVKTGNIVIASIDGAQTLKKIVIDQGAVKLKPANHKHDPIPVTDESDLTILGVVIALFRRYDL